MFLTAQLYNNDQEPAPDAIVDQNEVLNGNTPTLFDNFTDTNGTAISSHTPNNAPGGSSWAQTNASSFYIQSNTLQPNRQTDGDLAVIDSGISDITLSAIITPYFSGSNHAYAGLVFRYSNASNFWYVFPDTALQALRLFKVVAGVSTEICRFAQTLVSGTPYTVRVDCKGNNIIVYFNGSELATYVSTFNVTATNVGVRYGKVNSPASVCNWDSLTCNSFAGIVFNWPLFTEYASNPIIPLGSGFESADINDPSVVFDVGNNKFALLYSGYSGSGGEQQLGITRAATILGSWTKDASNPFLATGNIQNGGVVYFNNTYYYYYGNSDSTTIRLATSPDLLNWTDQGQVLAAGASGWDSGQVFDAFARVRQDGKTVELWYAAKDGGGNRGLGYVTSTDGVNFGSRLASSIITIPWTSTNNQWGEPSVYVPAGKEGIQMLLSFDNTNSFASNNRFIGQALTVNGGQTWHYRVKALDISGSGWESQQVFDSNIIVDSGTMYLFHSGSNVAGGALNINSQIGVASVPYPFTSLSS